MDDEDEVEGLGVGDAIEDEHRLDGEMPRAGTVGGGHDDSYRTNDERYEGTRQSEMRRKVEAEERQVVVNKVAQPDTYREEQEQRDVADIFQ